MTARFMPHRTKTLFYADHIKPVSRRQPRPCSQGNHAGPLLNTAVYNRFGEPWLGFGECKECGSTIHKSQLRPRAA